MLDIAPSCNLVQCPKKPMVQPCENGKNPSFRPNLNQTWENGKKLSFRPDFGPFDPNLVAQNFSGGFYLMNRGKKSASWNEKFDPEVYLTVLNRVNSLKSDWNQSTFSFSRKSIEKWSETWLLKLFYKTNTTVFMH